MQLSVKFVLKNWEVIATCGTFVWTYKFFTRNAAEKFAESLNVEGSNWHAEVRKVQL